MKILSVRSLIFGLKSPRAMMEDLNEGSKDINSDWGLYDWLAWNFNSSSSISIHIFLYISNWRAEVMSLYSSATVLCISSCELQPKKPSEAERKSSVVKNPILFLSENRNNRSCKKGKKIVFIGWFINSDLIRNNLFPYYILEIPKIFQTFGPIWYSRYI